MMHDESSIRNQPNFKSRWSLWVKSVSLVVVLAFLSQEFSLAADPASFSLSQ